MDINIWAVLVCAVAAMVLGYIWYGPLFRKNWARIIGMDIGTMTPERQKEMQKRMGPVMLLNFVLVFLTVLVLSVVINRFLSIGVWEGIKTAALIWLGFIMPMAASASMWSGKPRRLAWEMFLITASYQLVMFVIFGVILGAWM